MTLRVKRAAAPEPPFWHRTAISPYAARRGSPVSIDYFDLVASQVEKTDTTSNAIPNEHYDEPLLIDATEFVETIARRGEEALARFEAPMFLISTRGALPERMPQGGVLVISAWPLDLERLEKLFVSNFTWGVAVPILHPVTTNLADLERLADLAKGASFFTSINVQIDPAAKQELSRNDDDAYELLFHGDVEALNVATERHIAALAHERGMLDFIPPPRWEEKSNWNAAVLLTLTAARMIAMDRDVELAGTLARSARAVAALEKPIARIAEAASLSIVETLDEVSVDLLSEWLESGRASFAEGVNREWRLRRDAGLSSE